MVICKIGILNIQHVKENFATRKNYHLKRLTRKFIIINFLEVYEVKFVESN